MIRTVFVFYHVHHARGRETVLQVAQLEMDAAGKVVCDRDKYAGPPEKPSTTAKP